MKFKRPAMLQSLSLSVNLVSEGMQFLLEMILRWIPALDVPVLCVCLLFDAAHAPRSVWCLTPTGNIPRLY